MFFKLIDTAQIIIRLIRRQNYHDAALKVTVLTEQIQASELLCKKCAEGDGEFLTCLECMSNALASTDMILYADILEDSFIPYIKSQMIYEDVINLNEYTVEPSSAGIPTIYYTPGSFYLHSNTNPMEEARLLINTYYDENAAEYAVFGLGLGYHVKALAEASLGSALISVYETDKELIDYVQKNDFLGIFNNKNISINHDPSCLEFTKRLSTRNTGILFHYPSIMKLTDFSQKTALKKFYMSWNSYHQWKQILKINFNNNIINCRQNVAEIQNKIQNRKIIIIAAGPSLNHSLSLIKDIKKSNNAVVICVSTILKSLLKKNFSPDYVIVMDAQQRTYRHIEGIENCNVPIIIDSSAYWEFAHNYSGEKYLALQKGYQPAEDYANAHSLPLFNTGGSVTTLAIDIALQFGAKELYLAGVDMAFPDGKTHANGTIDENSIEKENLLKIKDVNGKDVYTSEQLYSYLTWIENRIAQSPEVKVYNLSDCGAMIEGTHSFIS